LPKLSRLSGKLESLPPQVTGMEARMETIRRRNLPHWDVDGAPYFVTTCLEGSIPAKGLLDLEKYRNTLKQRPRSRERTQEEWASDCWKLLFARADEWLDRHAPVRHLSDARAAQLVVNAMYHFAGERYDLLAFVVMPSHIHWVFQPREDWVRSLGTGTTKRTPRQRIIHGLNGFTGSECNRLLSRHGNFWQHESYDHWVRDGDELGRIILYIEANPVKASFVKAPEDWPYSSAKARREARLEPGQPLPRRVITL
jgi:type I restriction enzyme R subunit